MPKVPLEFTGMRAGGFTVYGPVTKAAYRFSIFARVQEVYEEDVDTILSQRNDFRRVSGTQRLVERPQARNLPPNIN